MANASAPLLATAFFAYGSSFGRGCGGGLRSSCSPLSSSDPSAPPPKLPDPFGLLATRQKKMSPDIAQAAECTQSDAALIREVSLFCVAVTDRARERFRLRRRIMSSWLLILILILMMPVAASSCYSISSSESAREICLLVFTLISQF